MTDKVPVREGVANLPMVVTREVSRPGDLIEVGAFTPDQLARRDELAAAVDFDDTNSILMFGVAPQKRINDFLDTLLEDVQVGEAGVAGAITLELSEGYDIMRIEEFKERLNGTRPGFFGKLFRGAMDLAALIKNLADRKMQLISKFDKIEHIANDRKRAIITSNTKLDTLQQESGHYIADMAVHIAAGEAALLAGVNDYDARRARVEAGGADDLEPARLHDLGRRIASFETRLLRMKIAYTQALAVTNPRIHGIRQAGEIEIQNILEAILFDLPNLKSLALQVAAMTNIQQAQAEDAERRAVSQKISGAAAEMFDEVYTRAVESQGRGLDDVRHLAETADKLIETLRTGADIEAENRKARTEAAAALGDVKQKVQTALSDLQADLGN